MSEIRLVKSKITISELKAIAQERFGDLIKAVIDIERGVMAIGGELHADEEAVLLAQGSAQADLWGINLYLDQPRDQMIEFDSMINIRPSQGNRSRNVGDETIRLRVIEVINKLIIE